MKKIVWLLLGFGLFAAASSAFASGAAAPLSTMELKKTVGVKGQPTIVFFQNPNGGPCKMQKQILDTLLQERKNNFNIAAVSTLKEEDQKAFYDYGIRSLPSLVLVDRKGNIARVFAPGIQSIETLSSALDGLK